MGLLWQRLGAVAHLRAAGTGCGLDVMVDRSRHYAGDRCGHWRRSCWRSRPGLCGAEIGAGAQGDLRQAPTGGRGQGTVERRLRDLGLQPRDFFLRESIAHAERDAEECGDPRGSCTLCAKVVTAGQASVLPILSRMLGEGEGDGRGTGGAGGREERGAGGGAGCVQVACRRILHGGMLHKC